jgi:hypothetical protein
MPRYVVNVCYSGYVSVEVDAENEDEAVRKAEADTSPAEINNLERWPEADMVEELDADGDGGKKCIIHLSEN